MATPSGRSGPAESPGSGGGDLTRDRRGDPAWYTDVELTEEHLEQVRGEGLTAAFLNWDDSSYNQAILAGARDALAAMNIELVATTNYSFDSTKLAASALNIAALQPDIVFYSGLDPVMDALARHTDAAHSDYMRPRR